MSYKKWYMILLREAKSVYLKSPNPSASHDTSHLVRVFKTAEKLGRELKADMEILIAACILHDLGRHYPGSTEVHGPQGALLAKKILSKIGFPAKKIPLVLDAIALHDFQAKRSKRRTIESKILYDADKINFFGNKGIARIFLYYPKQGKDLNWIVRKHTGMANLIGQRFVNLHYDASRKIVRKDYNYMIHFFKKLKKELK